MLALLLCGCGNRVPKEHIFFVANAEQWDIAINSINTKLHSMVEGSLKIKNRSFVINIIDNFSLAGTETNTFSDFTGILVTLNGEYSISLESTGNLIKIGAYQHLVLRNVTLAGFVSNDCYNAIVDVSGIKAVFTMKENSSVRNNGGIGVFIHDSGSFFMQDNASVSDNKCGGVVVDFGILNMSGGIVSRNESKVGGGVNLTKHSHFLMSSGSISENVAMYSGGGISLDQNSILTMSGGTISQNTATYDGGGINNLDKGNFTFASGSIIRNSASRGGGVYNGPNSTFTMTGGTIYGNTSVYDGGGVYNGEYSTFTISDGAIYGSSTTGIPSSFANNSGNYSAALYSLNIDTATYGDGGNILPHRDGINWGTNHSIVGRK